MTLGKKHALTSWVHVPGVQPTITVDECFECVPPADRSELQYLYHYTECRVLPAPSPSTLCIRAARR